MGLAIHTPLDNVILIGVAGGSCSGKTTLSQKIYDHFGASKSALIWQDDYYIDQSDKFDHDGGAVNFDHPNAIDFSFLVDQLQQLKSGQAIQGPQYDFATHTRSTERNEIPPKMIIIVDGILIFHHESLRNLFNFRFYLSASEDVRFERRLKRDTEERGRTQQGVHDQFFSQVAPMHNEFVSPTKKFAHRVITQENFNQSLGEVIEQITQKINCR